MGRPSSPRQKQTAASLTVALTEDDQSMNDGVDSSLSPTLDPENFFIWNISHDFR
jgi:hypothetical protein